MSKARLVITAVVVEGRSQSEVAAAYGVSQPWISRLVARYRAEGDAAFEPRSRRPVRSPSATSAQTQERLGERVDRDRRRCGGSARSQRR
jgi:transposase